MCISLLITFRPSGFYPSNYHHSRSRECFLFRDFLYRARPKRSCKTVSAEYQHQKKHQQTNTPHNAVGEPQNSFPPSIQKIVGLIEYWMFTILIMDRGLSPRWMPDPSRPPASRPFLAAACDPHTPPDAAALWREVPDDDERSTPFVSASKSFRGQPRNVGYRLSLEKPRNRRRQNK